MRTRGAVRRFRTAEQARRCRDELPGAWLCTAVCSTQVQRGYSDPGRREAEVNNLHSDALALRFPSITPAMEYKNQALSRCFICGSVTAVLGK